MKTDRIILKKKGYVRVVIIDHPPANTWDLATTEDMEKVVRQVEKDRDARVMIITGAGEKVFSAGFDVRDAGNTDKISPLARALWTRIDRFPKPVIASINGHAMGGGLELAMCCHFRIMADEPQAKLGLTELNLGIIPGWGGTQRLPRLVGRAKALDMIIFSETLDPQKALNCGLVDRLAPPKALMDEAVAFAEKLADRPPVAVKWVLKAMAAGDYEGMETGLEVEAEGSAAVRVTKDREEGFKAFVEKRNPLFTGE